MKLILYVTQRVQREKAENRVINREYDRQHDTFDEVSNLKPPEWKQSSHFCENIREN